MSRTKKSRTAGNSEPSFKGPRKESSLQAQEARKQKRKNKLKGNKAGARNIAESKLTQKRNAKKQGNDKRIGSSKAVPLVLEEKIETPVAPKKVLQPKAKIIKSQPAPKPSPEKELALIENDQRLNELLEQLDNDEAISQEDNVWVDKQMKRHQELMKKLGWLDVDGEEDLLQQFEDASSALNEFK